MTPKIISSTALTLIVAMGATSAGAQDDSSDAETSSSSSSDLEIMEQIEAADAPDTAETDPVDETASNEDGSSEMQAQSNGDARGSARVGAVFDLQTLSHDIYERGYRQGYIRGVQEARQDFEMQLSYMAKREQLVEKAEEWESSQSDASGSQDQQSASDTTSTGASGENPNVNQRSQMMGARPGGTVVILPDGVSPEQFIEQLVDRRNNGMQPDSGE